MPRRFSPLPWAFSTSILRWWMPCCIFTGPMAFQDSGALLYQAWTERLWPPVYRSAPFPRPSPFWRIKAGSPIRFSSPSVPAYCREPLWQWPIHPLMCSPHGCTTSQWMKRVVDSCTRAWWTVSLKSGEPKGSMGCTRAFGPYTFVVLHTPPWHLCFLKSCSICEIVMFSPSAETEESSPHGAN